METASSFVNVSVCKNPDLSGFLLLWYTYSNHMNDKFIRHFISIIGTVIAGLVFAAGYGAGVHSWWWVGIGVLIVYWIVYTLVEV